MIDRFLVCKGRFLFDRGTNVYFSPKVKQTWINCLFCLVLYSVYCYFTLHFIWGFIASSAFLLLPPIWSSTASFLYPSPAFSGRGGGIFRVFLFSASSVCFNVPFVVVLLHPLWYYWFHCFSFNCAFCPLSSICLSSASIVYPSTANYVFKIFLSASLT